MDINEILRNDPKYVAAFLKLILHEAETARLKQLVGEGHSVSDGVQQLQERIEATAMEHNVTTAHAVGLVWYEEGSNQNVYNAEEWAAVFAMLLGGGEGNAA